MMTPGKSRAGFSFVELIVAFGLASLVLSIGVGAFLYLNRGFAFASAASELRANQVRLLDSMSLDLRSATAVSNTPVTVGGRTTFLTLTLPQMYSSYEPTGPRGGDPSPTATRNSSVVNRTTGKVTLPGTIRVTYFREASGESGVNVGRTVQWTASGTTQTASRSVATLPSPAADPVIITVAVNSGSSASLNVSASLRSASNRAGQQNSSLAAHVFLRGVIAAK